MKQLTKKALAYVLASAVAFSGISVSALTNSASASAAKAKKVTLKLSKSKDTMKVGESKTFKIQKKNVKKIKSQKWSSTKKTVATVSKKGKVTAKKAGSTKIKVKVKYIAKGSSKAKTKTLTCTLKVTAGATQSTGAPGTGTTAPGTGTTAPGTGTTAPGTTTAPTATPVPTKDPETVVITDPVSPEDVTIKTKMDDTSNIGDEYEVSIVGGTSDFMTVKDNGEMRPELSSQYLIENEMGAAINLGNTMEATLPYAQKLTATEATQFEQAWGQPITTQEYIDCVHTYGINTIRIPVAWSNMIDTDTYEIDEKYLGRVEEIVNYVLNDGMYAIINIHWDSQWWGQFGACTRDEDGKKIPDEKWRQAAWDRYEALWTQIADRFQTYSDHLIFESANEELGTRLNDGIYPSTGDCNTSDPSEKTISGNLKPDELYDMTNRINQKFVDIVRDSGGNNVNRHLLIAGYNTNIDNTCDARFKMPVDLEENGNTKLSVSVHYYTPWDFCGDGADGEYTLADQMALPGYFEPLQKFTDAGYGIIIGECGIVNPTGVIGGVTQWLNDVFTEAAKYTALPVLWETGQYFDKRAAKLKFKDVAEFYNALTGSSGDTNMTKVTGLPPAGAAIDVSDKTPVWSWTGKWYKNGGDSLIGDGKFKEDAVEGVDYVKVPDTAEDPTDMFVPESEVTSTIDGDTTEIVFNPWGYQTFIKLDREKYKNPVIAFEFLDGTDIEDNVGSLQLGATNEAGIFAEDVLIKYANFHDGGIALNDKITLSDDKPWISVCFSDKPIVTAIHIYDIEE